LLLQDSALLSLESGSWFKLICGASYEHLPSIRNLALAYTLAGVDCIDVAADRAVINAALVGMEVAKSFRQEAIALSYNPSNPLLMVSVNDGEDPHFRKAYFNPSKCPPECDRPCEHICPADAIKFEHPTQGVKEKLCYGCGRCVPICPYGLIDTQSHVIGIQEVLNWLTELPINALEIHTQEGHFEHFCKLWQWLKPHLPQLQLIAISCPYTPTVTSYLHQIETYIKPLPIPLIWQTDGRPMSGDIGKGTTHLTIKYAQTMINEGFDDYLQLAGGTNEHTAVKMREMGLSPHKINGIAFGSKARKILADTLHELEVISPQNQLEDYPYLLWKAVSQAYQLVGSIKTVNEEKVL